MGKSHIAEMGEGLKGLLVVISSNALCWDYRDADTDQMSLMLVEP